VVPKAGKQTETEDDYFKPLEVPRPVVETSLTITYNQFHRNKDRVIDSLKKYRSSDDVKIIGNKSNAILEAIGEPVIRNTAAATVDKKGKD